MKEYLYLMINIGCFSIPFIFSFLLKKKFYKEWRYFLPANLIVAVFFLLWDEYFTQLQVWGFNTDYLSGFFVTNNLPLEEVLFFFCIPYACVFTYFVFREYIMNYSLFFKKRYFYYVFIFISLALAIIYLDRMYTFTTFSLLFLLLLYALYFKIDLSLITFSYLAIIPFFIISNGLLTGSFIENEVVWYDNGENLNFRFYTIPFEDVFYGYLLISLNILFYRKFKSIGKSI